MEKKRLLNIAIAALGAALVFTYLNITLEDSGGIGTAELEEEPKATILFVGDTMLGRKVEELMLEKGENYPFEKVAEILQSYDLVVANFEGTIPHLHIPTPYMNFRFSFRKEVAPVLHAHNIRAVNLANNHGYDFSSPGYENTKSVLLDAGVLSFGHPFDGGRQYVRIVDVNDVAVALVGFNATNPNFNYKNAVETVRELRQTHPEIFVVANVHWGEEYSMRSNVHQRTFAYSLIDAGADMIIGHHAHVVQEFELYNNRPIFYSLGNFVFDQYFSKEVQEGLMLGLTVSTSTIDIQLLPTTSSLSQPSLMEEVKKSLFLKDFSANIPIHLKDMVESGSIVLQRVNN